MPITLLIFFQCKPRLPTCGATANSNRSFKLWFIRSRLKTPDRILKHTETPVSCRLRNLILLLSVLGFFSGQPAQALEREVVVTLFKAHHPVNQVYIAGPVKVLKPAEHLLASGLYTLSREPGRFKLSQQKQTSSIPVYLASYEMRLAPLSATFRLGFAADSLRRYRGTLSISAEGTELVCRNRVSMRDYVSSVVGSETIAQFPEEALKAQSVLIQTIMQRYRKNDDLNDSTEKQVYLGADYERPAVLEAVKTTWGKTLSFDGRPVPVCFHAACAGGTSTSELFTGKRSGLACDAFVPCNYCRRSPFWQATRHQIPQNVFLAKFPEGLPAVVAKDRSGRPILMKYPGSAFEETGYSFWLKVGQRLGWDKMPGTRFEIKKSACGDIEFTSTGAGHGVGLCQWGASGMADRGRSYKEILNYYFPGSRLTEH